MGTVYDALNKEQREIKRTAVPAAEAAPGWRAEPGRWTESLGQIDPHLIMHAEADPAAVEQFKTLRTRLFLQRPDPPRTLLVASSVAGEGKTLVAANLAISLALDLTGESLLIDCDLRRPGLQRLFGLGERRGLTDYLMRGEPLENLIVHTPLERLQLLPAGGSLNHGAPEMLSAPRMAELFAELGAAFPNHRVICDCAPLSAGPDAAILTRYVDGALLVVMAQEPGREVVARALDTLGRSKVLGMVFNGVRPQAEARRYLRAAA